MESKVDSVLEFINRRFPDSSKSDAKWTSGNCYYFALILKDHFNGDIYYDVSQGHFFTLINDGLYDATGLAYKLDLYEQELIKNKNKTYVDLKYGFTIVNWEQFDLYDSLQKERIIRDCIM